MALVWNDHEKSGVLKVTQKRKGTVSSSIFINHCIKTVFEPKGIIIIRRYIYSVAGTLVFSQFLYCCYFLMLSLSDFLLG